MDFLTKIDKSPFEWMLIGVTMWTLLIQAYVVYLILKKSPQNIKEYRYFLILFTSWDMVFNIVFGLFLQPLPLAPILAASCRGISSFFNPQVCMITVSLKVF